jgi:predicted acetyltransferase
MNETLRAARERGLVVSALMPFRGSYYEHFGYGFVERRAAWTVPLDLIPEGDFSSVRFYRDADFEALAQCKQRIARSGQCDIERSAAMWKYYLRELEDSFLVVDREGDGPVRAWMTIQHQHRDGLDTVRAFFDTGWEDVTALKRLLYFLGSLRDQYRFAAIQLPVDLRLNLLLREKQMTHRVSKNHPNAEVRPFNRMQVRVLDHGKFLEAMNWPADAKGRAVVAVREPEGNGSKFCIEVEGGRAVVKASDAAADVECHASAWAAIACGDIKASAAGELGLIQVNSAAAVGILDALAEGPPPFCREYF